MDGTGSTRLPDTLLSGQAHAVCGGGHLRDQVADVSNRPAVASEVRQPIAVAQLLAQPIVVRQQAGPLRRRE